MTPPKPPMTDCHVFSYGSNMLAERLRARIGHIDIIATGYLCGRALRWHKLGKDGSGKCDAFKTGRTQDQLWGVVVAMSYAQREALDQFEGRGNGYELASGSVHMGTPSLECCYYEATHIAADAQPFSWYRDLVLAGAIAHKLPATHIEQIRATRAIADPDAQRQLRHAALLPASFPAN